ncbi:MAG: hypothetical protein ACLPSW_19765 [Roseiarcus sp.]
MSEEAAIAAFHRALRRAFESFEAEEQNIRSQYARDVACGEAPSGANDDELLERPTRRFLIDQMLRALGWNPDDPDQVVEEARSWDLEGERLYFDYLGVAPRTRAPVVLIEAKAYDAGTPRQPRGAQLNARAMAELISGAIADLKSARRDHPILVEWAEWLSDLRTYVASLDPLGRSTLRRVVSTAGRWVVVFEEPIDVFTGDGAPNVALIHCFVSLEDVLDRHAALFRLLHRPQLVDTLPLILSVAEAHEALRSDQISYIFRGVVVVTRESGGSRRTYPTRSMWPALIAISANRPFAVVDYECQALEDPRDPTKLADLIAALSANGAAFETRLLRMLGRADLDPRPVAEFPGFTPDLGRREAARPSVDPIAAAADERADIGNPKFTVHVGGRHPEYLVVSGENWFFKTAAPVGPACDFHEWPRARAQGVAASDPITGRSEASYTESGDVIHCAHEELRTFRGVRCKIDVLESHLCCRACIYSQLCWSVDADRLPCPP